MFYFPLCFVNLRKKKKISFDFKVLDFSLYSFKVVFSEKV